MHPDVDSERLDTGSLSRAVRALMLRKGISSRQQSKRLGEILRLSYSQAHRKLQGEVDWTLAQLGKVVEHFHESLDCLGLTTEHMNDYLRDFQKVEASLTLVGTEKSYRCRVWLGKKLDVIGSDEFVAQNVGNNWTVFETSAMLPNVPVHHVLRLELILMPRPVIKVAVQFNSMELSRELCERLRADGLDAYILECDTESVVGRAYGAFVIDWPINSNRKRYSVAEIRDAIGSRVPIYLLSDPVSTASAEEFQLTQLVAAYGVFWRERPIRINALVAELRSVVQINADPDFSS